MDFRGHKLTQNKVPGTEKIKIKIPKESPNTFLRKICNRLFLKITSSEKQDAG